MTPYGITSQAGLDNLLNPLRPGNTYYQYNLSIGTIGLTLRGSTFLEGYSASNNRYGWQRAVTDYAGGKTSIRYRSLYDGAWGSWVDCVQTTDLPGVLTAATDLVNIDSTSIDPGVYSLSSNTTGNKPFSYGLMVVIKRNAAERIEIGISTTTDMFTVRYYTGGSWSSWSTK